jgi:hypothetical protein
MSSHDTLPRVGDTLTTSASALVGIVREVVAHDTTPDLFRVRITVDAGTPDAFDKWTREPIVHKVTIAYRSTLEWMPSDIQEITIENDDIRLAYAQAIGTLSGLTSYNNVVIGVTHT